LKKNSKSQSTQDRNASVARKKQKGPQFVFDLYTTMIIKTAKKK